MFNHRKKKHSLVTFSTATLILLYIPNPKVTLKRFVCEFANYCFTWTSIVYIKNHLKGTLIHSVEPLNPTEAALITRLPLMTCWDWLLMRLAWQPKRHSAASVKKGHVVCKIILYASKFTVKRRFVKGPSFCFPNNFLPQPRQTASFPFLSAGGNQQHPLWLYFN